MSRPIVLLLLGLLSLPGLAVAAGGELGPELLTNGGMEEDSGWVSANSGSATLPRVNEQSAADKHSGAFSRYALISRATTNEWPGVSSPNFTTQTGQTLQIRFWYKVLRGSFTLLARNGENNNQVGPQPAAPFAPRFDPTGKLLVWSEYVGTYTERGGGAGAYLRFIISSSSDVEFFLDDVSVRAVDASPAAALRQWRARYPNRTLICWQKSPWTNLDQVEFPPAEPQECRALSLSMGRSEYESASFVLTNLSDQPLTVPVSVKPSLLTVTLRQAVWVTEVDGATCNDALPLLEGPLTIPSGGSREVWLTLQTRGSKPGDLRTAVEIKPPGTPPLTIPLRVKVYPVSLPDDKPLYTHYWDYLVPAWQGPELSRAYAEDLRQHYANVGVMHPWSVRMQFDAAGQLLEDYRDVDATLAAYRTLNPKILLVNLLSEVYFEKQEGFLTDPWKARFRTWLADLVNHLREQGFGYDRLVIYPYDEQIGPNVAAMAELIKQTDPKLRVYVNATGQSEDQVRAIAPYVDVWAPFLYDYMAVPPYDGPNAPRALAKQLLRKQDGLFWTYTNPLCNQPKLAPPYRDYRLAPWRAWSLGMSGCGYWIYSYKTHWNSYGNADGPNWAVVYLANAEDAPKGLSQRELVVPGKRWEATREGVEDVCYLYMLRAALKQTRQGPRARAVQDAAKLLHTLPASVLQNETDHTRADAAKAKLMAALAALSR